MQTSEANSKLLPPEWFAADAVSLAPKLLGKILRYGNCAGKIVEVEAYMTDPASHAFRITERSKIMQETYAHWYVYFTYGMHYCLNVTAGKDTTGAILIRALEPLEGIQEMEQRRHTANPLALTSGPAKLCKAFGITTTQNGLPLSQDFGIYDAPPVPEREIVAGPRIGIRRAVELPWRFYIAGNPFVSR